jgi:hypothetical protein
MSRILVRLRIQFILGINFSFELYSKGFVLGGGKNGTYLNVAPFLILAVDSAASRSLNWSLASTPPFTSWTLIRLLATLEANT